MGHLKIVEPPAAAIDWDQFSIRVQVFFGRPYRLRERFHFAQSTTMAAWHGKSIGIIPFLRICKAMSVNPLVYLYER